MSAWMCSVLAWLLSAGTPSTSVVPEASSGGKSYAALVVNVINQAFGVEHLSVGHGNPVTPALVWEIGPDKALLFDEPMAHLQDGRVADETIAPECRSGCPAVLYDAMQRVWLRLAIESAQYAAQMPTHVAFAVHRDVPAQTVLQAAYASGETRPGAVPRFSLVTSSSRRGLVEQPFFMVPPGGLDFAQGGALALTLKISSSMFVLTSTDTGPGRRQSVATTGALVVALKRVRKLYPGKDTVIVVPGRLVSTERLVEAMAVLQPIFGNVVLSNGDDVQL